MSYRDLLRDSFRITRHNRYLWFFGLFAGTSFNFPSFNANFGGGGGDSGSDSDRTGVGDFLPPPEVLIAIGVGVLVLVLLFVALSVISQGALAESVAAIYRGEQRSFRTAWRAGTSRFWRVLGLVVLLALIAIGLLLLVAIPLGGLVAGTFAATEAPGVRIPVVVIAVLIGIVAFICLFVPLSIAVQLALRELVVGGERPTAAIRGGYRLFRRHLGTSLLLWLIQIGIGIGAAIAILIVALVAGVILALPAILLAVAELIGAAIVVGVAAALVLLVPLLAAFGALGAFGHSFWTLAWLRLRAMPDAAGVAQAPPA
ncbi:MAG: hypothetical protein H0U12_02095 [Thermoleophilaceae bacterium]|nr:hypothetical protein [Thermoleophilaceae bacterium]